jgi:hypothetical protein
VATKPLSEISKRKDVDGLRLAIAVHKVNGQERQRKKLYVSGPLDFVSLYHGPGNTHSLGINGKNDVYITLDHKEV